jgi:hypothetical protein
MKTKTELILENMTLLRALGELVGACSNPMMPGDTVSPGVRLPEKQVLERCRAIHHRHARQVEPKKRKRLHPVEFENAELGDEG